MRFVKCEVREGAGRSGSVKASAMIRRNQEDAKRTDEYGRATESSNQRRNPDQRGKNP